MDFTTCRSILKVERGKKCKFNSVVIFRTLKIVIEKVVERKKGQWAQLLLDFDFRTIRWNWDQFQSILLLFSSLSLFTDHANYPCSVTTVLQQQYVKELCDIFIADLVTIREWTPLQWKAVHNISRIVSLSPSSKLSIMLYLINFINEIPNTYEEFWIQNCPSFCHSVTTAVFLFIEIYEANAELLDETNGFLKTLISLVYYFDCYKLGSPVNKDAITKGAPDKNIDNTSIPTTWSSKLVEKLLAFLISVFRQNYADGAKVPMEHALLGLDFPSCHVQTLSLLVVICHLRTNPQEELAFSRSISKTGEETKAVQNSSKIKPNEKGKLRDKVKKVRHALKLQDSVKKQKSSHFRVCESLYQSGQIRKIYWCLLNKCCNVRTLAYEVLSTSENILLDEKSDYQSAWQSSILEQGLVPLLELIACGFPISSTKYYPTDEDQESRLYFPEHTICMYAQSVLSRLAAALAEDSTLQEKLFLSLTHTQNMCIRGNILTGLLYLSSKSIAISKLLIRNPQSNAGESTNSLFADILSKIYAEESLHDLKNIVKIIYHFFQTRYRRIEEMVLKTNRLDTRKKDSRLVKEKLSLSTEILIKDKFNGSLVKMQCPDKKTLKAHSNRLVILMESVGSKSTAALNNKDNNNLVVLPGYYHVWQEIFSHMIDDFVMDTALAATGVDEILEMYQYSCKYELTHLCMRYTKELVNRLSTESFIKIFQCSIDVMTKTDRQGGKIIDQSAFNLQEFPSKLSLCCHCVRYFTERMSRVATPQNLQRRIIISESLELCFQFLLIAQ